MPAYNFQRQFVSMILDGSKPHTIRRRRKYPTKVGDVLMLFTGMRTKSCSQFAEAKCSNIIPVIIYPIEKGIAIYDPKSKHPHLDNEGWRVMETWEESRLAKRDGFNSRDEFYAFFERYKCDVLDDFEIIFWDPKMLIDLTKNMNPPSEILGLHADFLIIDDPFNDGSV